VPVLPGGVDEIIRRQSDASQMHFLYVGRLEAYKCVDDAIEAFGRLNDPKYLQWRFTIVGDGPERTRLELLAKGDARFTFTGSIHYDKLGTVFAKADVLTLPSEQEAWGLVVNEALGFGLYVITSDVVGSSCDLISESTGEVYPNKDVSKLSQAMASSVMHLNRVPRNSRTDTAMLMSNSLQELNHDS